MTSIYQSLAKWVDDTGHFKLYIASPSERTRIKTSLHVTRLDIRPFLPLTPPFYRELRTGFFSLDKLDRLLSEEMDVVHIATQGPFGVMGARFAKRHGLASLGYYHTDFRRYSEIYGARYFPFFGAGRAVGSFSANLMNRLVFGQCSVVLVQSKAYMPEVRRFTKCPVRLVPSGVDLDTFSSPKPIDRRHGQLRNDYLKGCKYLVIYVGRIAREKNLLPLLEVNERLNAGGIRLVLVGDGPLRQTIEESFRVPVTGYLLGERLIDAYRSADALIFPSETDTYGMVVLEAMACGLPVICSRIGGPSEIVGASNSGLVCNTRNPDEILCACIKIFGDKTLWMYCANNARAYAQRHCQDESFVEIMKWYEVLCRQKAA